MTERFNGPYVVSEKDDWDLPCDQDEVILEKDESGEVTNVGHNCPCGCGAFRMLPVNGQSDTGAGWRYSIEEQGRLTMSPSIQDIGKCQSHYFIRNGMVEWC